MSALSAPGRVARGTGRRPATTPPGREVLGETAERLRRPGGAAGDRRPGPGGAGGQQNRADVHRRPLGRLALRGPAPGGAGDQTGVGEPRRRPPPRRRLPDGGRPLRAARQQADPRRARQLPALPGTRAGAADRGQDDPHPRLLRLGRGAAGAARARGRGYRARSRDSATRRRPAWASGRWSAATTRASRTRSPGG